MFQVTFDMFSHDNESNAHMIFRAAMKLLDQYNIPYEQSVEDVYFPEPPGKKQRTFYVVYKILFPSSEDYTAYMLIKD